MAMRGLFRVVAVGAVGLCVSADGGLQAQTKKMAGPAAPATPIRALMLSDVHFDPFHDPGKAQQLVDAQEGEWNGILRSADSPDQAASFAKLQSACKARRFDTPYVLLQSSLTAMKLAAPDAAFALVSGDLVVHDFDCRFKALFPRKPEADYTAFVAKTVRYVVGQIRLSLTGTPVYVALGNNDSGCADYFMDRGDAFLKATEASMLDGLAASPRERQAAGVSYGSEGNFSVTMRTPMERTRLIVLNDTFQSRKYMTCGGKPDAAAVDDELSWLRQELEAARRMKQRVWVLGHIPAGLDPYSTFSKFKNVCKGDEPVMFLSSERLGDVLGRYSDVIKLGVFGHSHMDEIRLFGAEGEGVKVGKVPVKMVPSISPWDGNGPSFTVAKIDPVAATLLDYEVVQASNKTGINAVWTKEYGYQETFHEKDFSAGAVQNLLDEFKADPDGRADVSQAYLKRYFVGGDQSIFLRALWPQYVCTMSNHTVKAFAACACPAAPAQ